MIGHVEALFRDPKSNGQKRDFWATGLFLPDQCILLRCPFRASGRPVCGLRPRGLSRVVAGFSRRRVIIPSSVGALVTPRQAACFASLIIVLHDYGEGNVEESWRETPWGRTAYDGRKSGNGDTPIRGTSRERRRLGRRTGRRARPLRGDPPACGIRAEI
jgi:hypothetical protein